MARMEKYVRSSAGHLFEHYDRTQVGEHCEIKRPDLTATNYNLAPEGDQIERLRDIIGNKEQKRKGFAKCLNRKDVKVLCSWCVTMPKDLASDKEREFFASCYDFLCARYGVGGDGDKNIISAYVHRDETTPHMHFAFVPLAPDGKGGYKVSAKEVMTRQELRSLHKDMQEYVEKRLGCVVNIRNGATKEQKNKTVQELKDLSAEKRELAEVEALKSLEALSRLEQKCLLREAEKPNILLRLAGAEEHGRQAEIPYHEYLRLKKTLIEGIEAIQEKAMLTDQSNLITMLSARVKTAEDRCKEYEKDIAHVPEKIKEEVAAAIDKFRSENADILDLGRRWMSVAKDSEYGNQARILLARLERTIKNRDFEAEMRAKGYKTFDDKPKQKTKARTHSRDNENNIS